MRYISNVNAIIGVGNDYTMGTWRQAFAGPIYSFNNYGFKETTFDFDSKDFSSARGHFLFFASKSQVQKGLDLLLEIFPRIPDVHLYVCSDFKAEADFRACYQRELYETPNVHPIGRIPVNGPQFYDLVRQCAYVIAPTCSEGQPGSVVQCMYAGLIPLVTKEAGIDTERFGISFADDSLRGIERVIRKVSRQPEKWHRKRSAKTRRVAEKRFSEDALVRRWREILTEIIADAESRNARS